MVRDARDTKEKGNKMASTPNTGKFNWRDIRFGDMFNGFAIPKIQGDNGEFYDLSRGDFGPNAGAGSDIATAAYNLFILKKRIAAHEADVAEREEKLDEISGNFSQASCDRAQARVMAKMERELARLRHLKAAIGAGAPIEVQQAISADTLSAEQLTALEKRGYASLTNS